MIADDLRRQADKFPNWLSSAPSFARAPSARANALGVQRGDPLRDIE